MTLRLKVYGFRTDDYLKVHLKVKAPHTTVDRAAARPAPHSARALILLSRPSPPTWELPPSLPHPPVAKTYLPEPTAEDALGSEPAPA